MDCRLCGAAAAPLFHRGRRDFHRCAACGYVFVSAAGLPSPEAAARRYARHENDPADPGYRSFLGRLTGPLAERLAPGAEGLDYGCGPGPAVSGLLRERGFRVADYDPLFRPDPAPLGRRWDFVTCTEVVEHFVDAGREWERLFALVRPGGRLGVMTALLDGVDFAAWHYKEDPTHVGFYGRGTLAWLARRHGAALEVLSDAAAVFTTPAFQGTDAPLSRR